MSVKYRLFHNEQRLAFESRLKIEDFFRTMQR